MVPMPLCVASAIRVEDFNLMAGANRKPIFITALRDSIRVELLPSFKFIGKTLKNSKFAGNY